MLAIPFTNAESGAPTGESFQPVRIICIGRNYAEHIREMGNDPDRDPPIFFFKPLTALNLSGHFQPPEYSRQVEYEVELVLALGSGGRNLDPEAAAACVTGFGVGLDMTCRDVQRAAKAAGLPWELAKGFDQSAPISPLVRGGAADITRLGLMTLRNNGEVKQQSALGEMIWPVPELLAQVSQKMALVPGDLVFTGTPAGVGPVAPGDVMEAAIEGFVHQLHVAVV